jgi:hypothetical protein
MIVLFGCKTRQIPQNHDYRDSVYIERYIRDTLPADTSYIVTLIECDSLTNEPAIQLSDVYVDDLKLWIEQQTKNKFKFNVIKPQNEIKIIEQSNNSDKVEVVEIERKRSKFEWFLLSSGVISWSIIITYLIIKIYNLIKN